MNQKERLIGTLTGTPVDRPPFVCPGGMMTMVVAEMMDRAGCFWPEAHSDAARMARLTLAAHELAGIENVGMVTQVPTEGGDKAPEKGNGGDAASSERKSGSAGP
jgi:[methyl-Co(III) methanol-specific corrinoid protein]:coenzyme M methyltransferase